jgi:hypothetical protein
LLIDVDPPQRDSAKNELLRVRRVLQASIPPVGFHDTPGPRLFGAICGCRIATCAA